MPLPPSVRSYLTSRRSLLLVVVVAGALLRTAGERPRGYPSEAVAAILGRRGIRAEAADVTWVDAKGGPLASLHHGGFALLRGREGEGLADVYGVEVRLSPEGAVLSVGESWNLSRTSEADEQGLVTSTDGAFAAYLVRADGEVRAIHRLDLRGHPAPADFTRRERVQNAITQLQETGRASGISHDVLDFDAPRRDVALRFDGRSLLIRSGDDTFRVAEDLQVEGGVLRLSPYERARPPALVNWAVDRVRNASWFGDDRMQWVKAVAFTALDLARSKLTSGTGEETAVDDMGSLPAATGAPATPPSPRTDAGAATAIKVAAFPPASLAPMLSPPLKGEGQWVALEGDPFLPPGAGSAFAITYVRTDKERPVTRIYATLWDPRRIALHMEAGTVEPKSATGEAGPGLVPRSRDVLPRFVAGFNGGFQAVHGDYGMKAGGVSYLPPKPYAATVMELSNGSTAFGTWPKDGDVPADVWSFRQNMTALVQDGKYNPWGRTWWGGTPEGWADNIHTTRSGICLTEEGFVGYFYGIDVSPEALANGMLRARCTYGIHLDMNPGLCGFEFYHVQNASDVRPLGRNLDASWESEGELKPLADGKELLRFRTRRMIKSMGHMNFPQYIHRDARDFFYLTLRSDQALDDPKGTEPKSVVESTELGDGAHRFDHLRVNAGGLVVQSGPGAVVSLAGGGVGDAVLFFHPGHGFGIAEASRLRSDGEAAPAGATPIARGVRAPERMRRPPPGLTVACAHEGVLEWLSGVPSTLPATCKEWFAFEHLAIQTGGGASTPGSGAVGLGYPSAQLRFDTPPLPRDQWLPLQAARIIPKKQPTQ